MMRHTSAEKFHGWVALTPYSALIARELVLLQTLNKHQKRKSFDTIENSLENTRSFSVIEFKNSSSD